MTQQEKIKEKPVIGITIGDFNGIGPEVILKTLAEAHILQICTPVVYGSGKIFNKYKRLLNFEEDIHFNTIKNSSEIHSRKINLINCWEEDYEIEPGKVTEQAGVAAFKALERAANDLEEKSIAALVTAPINKKNIQQEDFRFAGHTEFLATKFKGDALMMLVSDVLRIAVVTGHIPLSEVKPSITKEALAKKLTLFYTSLKKDFQIIKPKIAVLGLNPHAGEDGLLGDEEKEIIIPLIEDLRAKGLLIFGPYSADGFFGTREYRKFDGVLAMYHDQGLIPFKTISFETGVNFTAGLSVIRTSPDHGTAYEIAGKNRADEGSFREAVYLAIDLIKEKAGLSL